MGRDPTTGHMGLPVANLGTPELFRAAHPDDVVVVRRGEKELARFAKSVPAGRRILPGLDIGGVP